MATKKQESEGKIFPVEIENKAKTAETSHASDPGGFCVYIGPSIVGVIQYGTVYAGSKEVVMKKVGSLIEKYPLTAQLLVNATQLPESRRKVKAAGNYLYNAYQNLMKSLNTK